LAKEEISMQIKRDIPLQAVKYNASQNTSLNKKIAGLDASSLHQGFVVNIIA